MNFILKPLINGVTKCNHIKRLIKLTSSYKMPLSLKFQFYCKLHFVNCLLTFLKTTQKGQKQSELYIQSILDQWHSQKTIIKLQQFLEY